MNDQRYILAKERLMTLSNEELQRIIDNVDIMLFDTYNFNDGKFCPIAIAMNLHVELSNPSNEAVGVEMGKRFIPTNIFKGTEGEFYTTNRKEDILTLCKEILTERHIK